MHNLTKFCDMSEEKKQDIVHKLYFFCENLENLFDVKTFLCGGTFLGAYRDRDFIAHDDDVDINYYCPNIDNMYNAGIFSKNIFEHYLKLGLLKKTFSSTHAHIWLDQSKSFYVDVFPCIIDTNNEFVSAGPTDRIYDGLGSSNHVFPLTQIDFRNRKFNIPNNPVKFAEWMWGKDWEKPKKIPGGYWPQGIKKQNYNSKSPPPFWQTRPIYPSNEIK